MLALDTSSARSAVALLDGDRVVAEVVKPSGRDFDVAAEVAALVPDPSVLDSVLVALGPGSFTGLRQGIAFAVGLAMSLRVPLLGAGTLDLVAARSPEAVLAVSEAGRGRLYFLAPDGSRGVAAADALPGRWPVAGWLRGDGVELLPEERLRTFGEAVAQVRGRAKEVGYGTVKPEYMTEFGAVR